jgi:hypothetical protein
MPKQKSLELVIPEIPINGFCYPYAKALLEKFKELVFKEEAVTKLTRGEIIFYSYSDICYAVACSLREQIPNPYKANGNPTELISLAEEFLAIFEK